MGSFFHVFFFLILVELQKFMLFISRIYGFQNYCNLLRLGWSTGRALASQAGQWSLFSTIYSLILLLLISQSSDLPSVLQDAFVPLLTPSWLNFQNLGWLHTAPLVPRFVCTWNWINEAVLSHSSLQGFISRRWRTAISCHSPQSLSTIFIIPINFQTQPNYFHVLLFPSFLFLLCCLFICLLIVSKSCPAALLSIHALHHLVFSLCLELVEKKKQKT